MQKLKKKKKFEEKLEELKNSLSVQSRLSTYPHLAGKFMLNAKKTHKEVQRCT